MKFFTAIAALALIVTTTPANAIDWYRWRGPDLNGISKETGWLAKWPAEGPKKLWEASVGIGYSSFAVAKGKLYTMGNVQENDIVFCLDAETGDVHWVYESKGRTIASTLVADGKVYLANEKHLDVLAAGKKMRLLDESGTKRS